MKKYLLAAVIGSLASAASATCPYPLMDETSDRYDLFLPLQPFQSVDFQSVENIMESTAGIVNYQVISDAMVDAVIESASTGLPGGDITLPTSGIVAFEWQMDHFPAAAIEGGDVVMGGGFASSNFPWLQSGTDNAITVAVALANSPYGQGPFASVIAGNRIDGALNWGTGGQHFVTLPLPSNYRVGIYLNMNTRQVGFTLNGVDKGYLQNEQSGPFLIPTAANTIGLAFSGFTEVADNHPLIGSPVGGTLITDSAHFTQPFPAGTTGFTCGTTGGNGGLKLPNGKPYPGKANPPGLQKFQPLLLPSKPLGQLLKANR